MNETIWHDAVETPEIPSGEDCVELILMDYMIYCGKWSPEKGYTDLHGVPARPKKWAYVAKSKF